MARKKTKSQKLEWEHFGAAVKETEVSVESGINHEVWDKKWRHGGVRLYKFRRYISFRAVVIWPEEQVGEEVWFSIYKMPKEKIKEILSDIHLKDKRTGEYRYQKIRGESQPVYGEPESIGLLEKARKNEQGKQVWSGHARVSDQAMNNITSLLLSSKQTYFHPAGIRDRKYVRLSRVSVSLGDPGDWEEFQKLKDAL